MLNTYYTMSELYIYDDDLVEDYKIIETLKSVTNSIKVEKKENKISNC